MGGDPALGLSQASQGARGGAIGVWALVGADVIALAASFYFSIFILQVSGWRAPWDNSEQEFSWAFGFAISALCFVFIAKMLGLYPGRGMPGPERIKRRLATAQISVIAPIAVIALHDGSSIPMIKALIALAALAFLSPFLEMLTINVLDRAGLWRSPVVVHGSPEQIERISGYMNEFPELGFKPVARASLAASANASSMQIIPRVDDGRQIWTLAATSHALPFFAPVERAELARIRHEPDRLSLALKRLLDIAILTILALPAALIVAVVAVFIVVTDGFPIFYWQERRGLNGKKIRVWKLRSMRRDAEERLAAHLRTNPAAHDEWVSYFKLKDDPRILPGIGNFIRKSSIDELPQLWNVLSGDMSMIGPRPFPDYHLETFSEEFRILRSRVLPGLSGLWQVTMRSDGNSIWQEELDRTYVESWSIWMDIYILLRTPIALFSKRGAR